MADGPRCKRRKQANPKRNNVTNYNSVVEGQSDSDDEDKLHIVEEDPDGDSTVPEDASVVLTQNGTETHQDTWDGVKEDCGSEEEDEEEGEEGEEEEGGKDALVEEMLQQGDTAVIFPEAPEDEQKSMPERRVPDENGTPDALSQLLTCPYCSRGYKRCTALKEHIKLRHEKSEDNFSCSQCSYTFAYRTQLDRHMTQHKTQHKEPVQRHVPQTTTTTGGNRKFMCTECSKAFKYKHHLKEHLRIHSGEKPYECPNCKKRFSHSGSYSSHISSKKCVGMVPVNGTPRPVMKASQTPTTQTQLSGTAPVAPTRLLLRGEKTDGKPLQEQLPVNQIKSEPVEYEYKPVAVGPNGAAGTNGTVFTGGVAVPQGTALPQGMVQAVVLPTVGLMSPISINLSDLQNVLKVAMDGNVFRQVLGTANGLVTSKQGVVGQAGQQVISAISLPGFVDQDGTTKIIINYTLEPSLAQQPSAPQLLKKEPPPVPTTTNTQPASKVTEKLTQDLSIVKTEQPDSESEKEMETEEAQTEAEAEQSKEGETPKAQTGKTTCLLCDDCPDGLDALHMLQHCKPTNGEGGDGSPLDPSIAALLAEAGITPGQPPLKNLLSLLKAYFALNAEPTEEELAKISDNVSLPMDIVKKWFEKMQSGQITVEHPASSSPLPSTGPSAETQAAQEKSGEQTEEQLASAQTQETSSSQPPNSSPASTSASPVVSALAPSPLNLSSSGLVIVKTEEDSEGESQDLPLDLSLPKQPQSEPQVPHVPQEQPLNLTCLKKETLQPQLQAQLQPQLQAQLQAQLPGFQTQLQAQGTTNTIYVTSPPQMATSSPVNIMTTQLVAITNQGSGVPCLRAISTGTTKRTILIPQLTYTYTTKAGSNATGADGAQKTVILNGCQEEKADTSSESVSAVEEQNDSDSAPPQKKMRRLGSGMYACDLCDKIFQKSSSLLRHKYEHTGKRPHECGICNKAFKHKHHLIEHTRLHSGEKPYRCDKCGKCFSHSGSYSQHMNHRYSYCKKEPQGDHQVGRRLRMTPEMSPQTEEQQSDSRPTSPPSQLDSDERESEEELEEEEGEEEGMEAMSMDDIRVVQVGEDDEESEIYEVEEFGEERPEEEEEGSREEKAQQEEEEEGRREEEKSVQQEQVCEEEEEGRREEEEEGRREEKAQQEEEEGQQEKKEDGRREEEKSVQQEQVCEEEEEGRREEEEEGRREEAAHQGEEEEWIREEESREESVQQEDVYEEEEEMEVQVMGNGEGEEGVAEKETVVTEKAKETEDNEPHVDKENITDTLETGQKERGKQDEQ